MQFYKHVVATVAKGVGAAKPSRALGYLYAISMIVRTSKQRRKGRDKFCEYWVGEEGSSTSHRRVCLLMLSVCAAQIQSLMYDKVLSLQPSFVVWAWLGLCSCWVAFLCVP